MDGEYKKLAEATPRTMPDSQLDMIWENDLKMKFLLFLEGGEQEQ